MIIIDAQYCKGCGICIHFCPKNVLEASKTLSARGYFIPSVVDEDACTKCGRCELYCPDFAIFVVTEKERGDG
jgi:2-oxoglutarate ferredoxin oxidoreductase subunit delta